ncbi:hypothetical protein [Eubacterium sp. An3]|uniref:hypothetical protein n=1 Tax=Eubacterium sp. An3 TaxID=1965628 RepID=UPI000B3704F2|nr:hypothetical protein [Eubacterium sp. An3]OUO29890.1 hypothetical protein B5F87_00140 [Eubacterium sp. An3]
MSKEQHFDSQTANDKGSTFHRTYDNDQRTFDQQAFDSNHSPVSFESSKYAHADSDTEVQYDQHAKALLGHRIVLAHILAALIPDFHGWEPWEILPYIDSQIYTGVVPTEPGQTNEVINTTGKRIVGLNTENSELYEGQIYFDVLFYLRLSDRRSRAIVDVEAQKDEPSSYRLLHRGIFYVCRLVSSQKERDFTGMHFNDLLQVYSIWICMNMKEDFTEYFALNRTEVLGDHVSKGCLGLLNLFIIGLSGEVPDLSSPGDARYRLHRLLRILFSPVLSKTQKFEVLRREYGIAPEHYDAETIDSFRKEVDTMCNLSQGVKEYGIKIGREEGLAEGYSSGRTETLTNTILRSFQLGFSLENISSITDMSIEKIKEVIWEEIHVRV